MSGTRAAGKARTHTELVAAGLRVVDRVGIAGLSVNRLVAEAAVSKGTFFHHFPDRAAYLVELHRTFHDDVAREVAAVVDGMPAGRERLIAATQAYLDLCLRQRGVRALLLDARAEPAIRDEVRRRDREAVELVAADFLAMGRESPRECAQLWLGMAREVAAQEFDTGPQPSLRAVLPTFVS